jgi:zinc transport system substrate-binding protein
MKRNRVIFVLLGLIGIASLDLLLKPGMASEPNSPKIRVLCSVFPIYQFTRNVAQGSSEVEVGLLLAPGLGCPHDYSLAPQDIQRISHGDVLIINGFDLEEFIGASLKRANPNVKIVDAAKGIPGLSAAKEEDEDEHQEGKQEYEKTGHQHHHGGMNPHLFSSPRQAAKQVLNIGKALAQIDPANRVLYLKNAKDYARKLEKLADEFSKTVKKLPSKKIVTVHEVFDYLAKDSGLEIVAVIESRPGTEPSAAEMLAIVKKIKVAGAKGIFTEPQYSPRVGQTIARETHIPVATLDPVASGPTEAPMDYYEKTMTANLETLKKVLHGKK